jgi:predicted transposase YbfD/YdcC
METVSPSRIVNCDESFWLLHPKGIPTWAALGCQAVQTKTNGAEKDCITIVARVILAGEKLTLAFLAPGQTARIEESQIGAVEGHWRTHSKNGWQISEMFRSCPMKIHAEMGEGSIHLLLDSHSAYRTNDVRETAARLGITLHFIPRA